jgi:hypothetical protein
MSAAKRVAQAAETIRARWERNIASDPQTEAAQALEDSCQLLDPEVAEELERLRRYVVTRQAREEELLATLGRIDLRRSPEAWSLGMTFISHMDGPFYPCSAGELEPGLRALIEQLRVRIGELETERHSTNEALDDAVQELRRRETGPALPWAHTMPDDDLSGFLNDLVSAAVNRWQSDPEVPDRETLAAVEKACAAWRTPGQGYRSDEDEPAEAPPLTVFRASHDSIAGHNLVFDWIEDDEDRVAELVVTAGQNEESTTGYVVEALEIASAYDPDADE